MTLKVVKDTSTNWTNAEWRIIDRMKKNYSEMDERSMRAFKLGDDLLALFESRPEDVETTLTRDSAYEIGCAATTLRFYGYTAEAWPAARRTAGVGYSVFETLAPYDGRFAILADLVKEYGAEGVTKDAARRAVGIPPTRPQGLKEFVSNWDRQLDRFMGQRLYAADRLALQQHRLKIDILLGEAEEQVS
jgi:hypothetical protein